MLEGKDRLPLLGFGVPCSQAVEKHVRSLQAWLAIELVTLKHANGQPVVKLFGGHHHKSGKIGQSCIFQVGYSVP
jgi:hypothetical protein